MTGLGYGQGHFSLIDAQDTGALEQALWPSVLSHTPAAPQGCPPATFNLSNEKRTTLDFALDHLASYAPASPASVVLSNGAPYGQVEVNATTCTLCMACVGACPEGALLDAKDTPQLKFIERNCVQCGLCEKTCPEDAITLTPRLLLGKQAKAEVVLDTAEPFHCVRCAKPFGTRQMVDNMLGRLGTHSMFPNSDALRRLQMCADCRVIDMMENKSEGKIADYRGENSSGREGG
jgi:ferredoxin